MLTLRTLCCPITTVKERVSVLLTYVLIIVPNVVRVKHYFKSFLGKVFVAFSLLSVNSLTSISVAVNCFFVHFVIFL